VTTTGERRATAQQDPQQDPLQDHLKAIDRLAALIADGDEERRLLVFQALANQVDDFLVRDGEEGVQHARSVLTRTAEPHLTRTRPRRGRRAAVEAPALPADSIYTDPIFQRNSRKLIRSSARIVGGVPTSEFPDCIAVGHRDGWCCTGTLVAPNVVVTAAHCVPDCAQRIFVGEDVDDQDAGQVVAVRTAVAHPDYRPPDPTSDIAVLILAEAVQDVTPRPIAEVAAVDAAPTVRLVGYGNTDVHSTGGYGRRRLVDVPVAGEDARYGADFTSEFVAGAPFLDRDSCNGDSGGPAYVAVGDGWQLAGATSRATASAFRPCGDGGIYTRVAFYGDWIRSVPGGMWG
jgi:secreted trypsin-like serine protease